MHFVEPALETDPVRGLIALAMLDLVISDWVLRVPHIMCDKLLDLVLPSPFQIVVLDVFDLVHEALNIFDKDVIACDKNSFLGPIGTRGTWLGTRIDSRLHGCLSLRFGRGSPGCSHALLDTRH